MKKNRSRLAVHMSIISLKILVDELGFCLSINRLKFITQQVIHDRDLVLNFA